MAKRDLRTALVVTAWVLQACSTPYKTPAFDSRPAERADFPGVAQIVAATKDKSADVVMIHGMCTHDDTWARASIARLSRLLGGPSAPAITPEPVAGTKVMLYRSALTTPHGAVQASAIVWSPITAGLKSQLCYDQSRKSKMCSAVAPDAPPYPYERAGVNRALKDDILDDCLADALIYQGKSREAISSQVQQALLAASVPHAAGLAPQRLLASASAQARPIVFISASLGSKVAFDAILQLQRSPVAAERSAGTRLFDRFAQIFMEANQLPILALADQEVGAGAKANIGGQCPADPLSALLCGRKARPSLLQGRPLQVVAFTDPNDLLSYALARSTEPASFDVVDVIVSNASTLFGWVERPDQAHTAYEENDAVTRLIACGTHGCP